MNTDIEYLSSLEQDLTEAAARSTRAHALRPAPQPRMPRWFVGIAATISLLLAAGLIGWLATGGTSSTSAEHAALQPVTGTATDHGLAGPAAPTAVPGVGQSGGGLGPAQPSPQPVGDLTKIIRDGSISIEVPRGNFSKGFDAVTRIADEDGGFVLSSQTRGQRAGSLTLRIPAKRFDRAMLALRAIGVVQAQSITGRVVTAEFVDLHARLLNLIGQRTVLRNLMSRATTIADTITVESHLQGVQLQIEQIQGQLNLIDDQVAEATVRVDLHEKAVPSPSPAPTVKDPSLGRAWHHAVQGFLNVVSAVVVGLGYLIPVLVLALAGWLLALVVRRRRAAI